MVEHTNSEKDPFSGRLLQTRAPPPSPSPPAHLHLTWQRAFHSILTTNPAFNSCPQTPLRAPPTPSLHACRFSPTRSQFKGFPHPSRHGHNSPFPPDPSGQKKAQAGDQTGAEWKTEETENEGQDGVARIMTSIQVSSHKPTAL